MTVEELLERLRRIPRELRTWDCDEELAHAHFGLDGPLLHALVAQGLPHDGDRGAMRFARVDLHCVGVHLGCAQTYVWAAQRWARSLELLAEREATIASVDYVPQLPTGAAPTPAIAVLPDGTRRAVVLESGRTALTTRLRLSGCRRRLPAAAAHAACELARRLAFCPLPEPLRGDTHLARRAGLSDCATAARLIVEEWEAAGLEARIVDGLLVSEPYSTLHTWAEVRDGDGWLAADPLMLGVMCHLGGLDRERWPPDRSVDSMVHRIDDTSDPLVTTSGEVIELTFLTSLDDVTPRRADE
ncbi:MAG TPA: transglutaminase domain-containing protein [Conexibacter sp.]|jgi:hypothetical protein|nr:transglutaminase domain-containing protein [Conexibacter sp.]